MHRAWTRTTRQAAACSASARAWPTTLYLFSNLATQSPSVSRCLGVTPARSAEQSLGSSDITASARATSRPAKCAYPPPAWVRLGSRPRSYHRIVLDSKSCLSAASFTGRTCAGAACALAARRVASAAQESGRQGQAVPATRSLCAARPCVCRGSPCCCGRLLAGRSPRGELTPPGQCVSYPAGLAALPYQSRGEAGGAVRPGTTSSET